MRAIDVKHQGLDNVICAWHVDDVIVDPGPESTSETLLDALGDEEPRALALTHIHFDHAGAAGALVRRWPELEVWVHERGARHLVDPTRLVASAKRLYGDTFDRLWGEVVPVPAANIRVLRGGEREDGWEVAYTPGHASHHVSYRHLGQRLGLRGRHRRRADAARAAAARADAAAGVPPRVLAGVDRHARGVGATAPRDHAFRRLRRRLRAPRSRARGAHALDRARRARPIASATPRRCAPSSTRRSASATRPPSSRRCRPRTSGSGSTAI